MLKFQPSRDKFFLIILLLLAEKGLIEVYEVIIFSILARRFTSSFNLDCTAWKLSAGIYSGANNDFEVFGTRYFWS